MELYTHLCEQIICLKILTLCVNVKLYLWSNKFLFLVIIITRTPGERVIFKCKCMSDLYLRIIIFVMFIQIQSDLKDKKTKIVKNTIVM